MSLLAADRDTLGWWVLGFALAVVVAYVAASFVGVIVFGAFLYYATRPVYRRIRVRVDRPNVAAAVSLFALALPVLLLVTYVFIVAARELQQFTDLEFLTGIGLPEVGDEPLLEWLGDPATLFSTEFRQFLTPGTIDDIVRGLLSAADTLVFIVIALIHMFVLVAFAFYLLRDDGKIRHWFLATFETDRGLLTRFLRAVDDDFQSIFFGNILNAFITGAIGAIVFSLLNIVAPAGLAIPAAALVGLIAGVASLIPIVGMKLVYIPVALYLAGRSVVVVGAETLWFVALFVLVAFFVVDTIPDLILRPYISGRSLHVGAVMLAYTLGPLLFGWYGIFLMPMLLVIVVRFAQIILPELVEGEEVDEGGGPGGGGEPVGGGASDDVEEPDDGERAGQSDENRAKQSDEKRAKQSDEKRAKQSDEKRATQSDGKRTAERTGNEAEGENGT